MPAFDDAARIARNIRALALRLEAELEQGTPDRGLVADLARSVARGADVLKVAVARALEVSDRPRNTRD